MGITKWDLYKQIDKIPAEKYQKIKEYLEKLTEQKSDEVVLNEKSKIHFEKSLEEYSKGEYLTNDKVFEDGENE